MNHAYFIPIIMMFIVLFVTRQNNLTVIKNIMKKRKTGDIQMFEMAKKFLGKECIVYTFNSQLTGIIKEVSEGGILLLRGNAEEAVNFDFIVRIREYPRNKNGKKKSVIFD